MLVAEEANCANAATAGPLRQVEVGARVHVTVCACTYRRAAGLGTLLEAVRHQRFFVVVDNEGSEETKAVCERFRCASEVPICYIHEPRRGISYARNRCLDEVAIDCDFIAMIDDDEIPDPDWMEQLLQAQEESGADVVEGRVVPVYPEGAPAWIVQGHYFGWHHDLNQAHRPGQRVYPELDEARTNSVLVRCAVVRRLALRFDPRLALTGGEDIEFLRAIGAAGHRIVYAPDTYTREMIPLERTSLGYLWRQWYRVGANARRKRGIQRKRNATLKRRSIWKWHSSGCACLFSGFGTLSYALLRGRTGLDHLAPGLRRFAHGLGQIASAIGVRYEHYR